MFFCETFQDCGPMRQSSLIQQPPFTQMRVGFLSFFDAFSMNQHRTPFSTHPQSKRCEHSFICRRLQWLEYRIVMKSLTLQELSHLTQQRLQEMESSPLSFSGGNTISVTNRWCFTTFKTMHWTWFVNSKWWICRMSCFVPSLNVEREKDILYADSYSSPWPAECCLHLYHIAIPRFACLWMFMEGSVNTSKHACLMRQDASQHVMANDATLFVCRRAKEFSCFLDDPLLEEKLSRQEEAFSREKVCSEWVKSTFNAFSSPGCLCSLSTCPCFMDQDSDVEDGTSKHGSGMVWQRSKLKVTVPLPVFWSVPIREMSAVRQCELVAAIMQALQDTLSQLARKLVRLQDDALHAKAAATQQILALCSCLNVLSFSFSCT